MVVPDDNILCCLNDTTQDLTKGYGRLIKYVMTQHERDIASFKENIPAKARKANYPHILWIMLPMHTNFLNNDERFKFNRSLEDISKFHSGVTCLELKKVWDPKDGGLYSKGRYTSDGFKAYWDAVDRTIRYCDSVMLKKREKFAKKQSWNGQPEAKQEANDQKDQANRFHWRNPNIKDDVRRFKNYRRLPSPPRRR